MKSSAIAVHILIAKMLVENVAIIIAAMKNILKRQSDKLKLSVK